MPKQSRCDCCGVDCHAESTLSVARFFPFTLLKVSIQILRFAQDDRERRARNDKKDILLVGED